MTPQQPQSRQAIANGPFSARLLYALLVLAWVPLAGFACASPPNVNNHTVLVLGDSISAAYGLPTEYGWVALLDEALEAKGISASVVNASISGETTSGGLSRLPSLLQQHPVDTLIIELGGNNALRGQPLDIMREELRQMIHLARDQGARVLLIGMHLPPNYGRRYAERFHRIYRELSEQEQTALVPFLLDGFATTEGMMQDDGIHPSAAAQPLMLNNVLPHLLPLLQQAPLGESPAASLTPQAP